MATKSGSYSSGLGFGTFGGRITGGNMVLDFTPNVGTAVTTNTSFIVLSDTATGVSSITFQESRLNSNYKSISISGSPSLTQSFSLRNHIRLVTTSYLSKIQRTISTNCLNVLVIASESNEAFVEYLLTSTLVEVLVRLELHPRPLTPTSLTHLTPTYAFRSEPSVLNRRFMMTTMTRHEWT